VRRHARASAGGSTFGAGGSACLLGLLISSTLLALASTALFASAALGSQTHFYTGTSFGPDGSAGSSFNQPGALATDSAGNLYLAEIGQGLVEKFSAAGAPLDFSSTPGSNEISGIGFHPGTGESQVAVAPASGAIYATNTNGDSILAFAASGEPLNFTAGLGVGTNAIPGFSEVLGVAVDANGAIYTGDYSGSYGPDGGISGGVAVYAATGELLSTFQSPQAGNLAVDSAGNVYVAQYSGHVTRFEPSSFPVTATTTYTESGEVDPATSNSVAVNPSTDDVYVDHGNQIAQYTNAGVEVGRFPGAGSGLLNVSLGVSARGSGASEIVYASDTDGAGQVRIFGPLVTAADATTGEATEITNTSAKLAGIVNPDGTEASYQFEYGTSTAYGEVAPSSPALVGNDSADHPVETVLSGLEPNTVYHYRLDAINSAGSNSGEDMTFRTFGPADVETTGSLVRTTSTALLEGRLNPQGKPTSYYFEYGTAGPCDSSACTKTAPVAAGEGEEIVFVAELVSGLSPAMTYHYRVVADNGNSAGLSFGEDMTVTTRADETPLSHGAFPGPPGSDRAWEQVSAPETGGHAIDELKAISDDGKRVLYNVKGGTPEATVGVLYTPLFAERHAAGWQSQNILPPQQVEPGNEIGWFEIGASSDLSTLIGQRLRSNSTSLWDLSPGGSSIQIFTNPLSAGGMEFYAVSDDGSRIVARPGGLNENLYDVTSGTPELISFLPDGSVPSCGVSTVRNNPQGFVLPEAPLAAARWVSTDGSLVFFPSEGNECGGDIQLYVRDLQSEVTKRISPPPVAGPECGAAFIKSTADAAYFWSTSRLAAEDTFTPGSCFSTDRGDVYRYDLSDDTVDCLTCIAGKAAEVNINRSAQNAALADIAVADDGSRIYFTSTSQLVSGAAVPGIYRLRPGSGNLRYVAPGRPAGNVGQFPSEGEAMTPDGSTIIFRSSEFSLNPIGGLDNGGNSQYYLYDDDGSALTCATCVQDGTATAGSVLDAGSAGGVVTALSNVNVGPNVTPIASSGDVFAFATPSSLVRQDQNAAKVGEHPRAGADAYEWRDGRLLLLSDGISSWFGSGAEFSAPKIGGVSQSGDDVYFTVAAQLTPDALDSGPRLYDARIGGGFDFPKAPPPCPLEVCQGTPGAPPPPASPGSASFNGPGNLKPKPRKKQRKQRAKQKKKQRQKSRKKQASKRRGQDGNRANHNRRISR
jgi:sugar lactone lactonase YvrE